MIDVERASACGHEARRLEPLRKVADDGFGRAGRGLSEMTGVIVEANATQVSRLPLTEVPGLVGGAEAVAASVYLAIRGDVEGHMVLMLPVREACDLADMLLEQAVGTTAEMDDLARSALGEVGNIVGSFFLAALADASRLSLAPSPPTIIIDMAGAVLDAVLAELAVESDETLVVDTVFTQSRQHVNALFLVLPRQRHLELILDSLQSPR